MKTTDKILEKLRKLTNLKNSAMELGNIGEMNAAAAGISRLLLEYNLSEEDIPVEEREENPIIIKDLKAKPNGVTIGVGKWYRNLLRIICKHNMCKLIATTCGQKVKYFSVIGRTKNVEIVEYLESFLVNKFYQCAKAEYKEYKQLCKLEQYDGTSQADYIRSFMTGAYIGLNEKLEEMKKEAESQSSNVTALVLQREKEIEDFAKQQFSNLKTSNVKQDKCYSSGYYSGLKTGRNTDIHQGINSSSKNQKYI